MLKPCKKIKSKICFPLLVSSIIFSLTFVGRIYVSGKMVQENMRLKEISSKKIELEKEVSRLRYDDIKLSSLESVKERSVMLGFVPMNTQLLTLDITQSPPLALNSIR